MEKLFTNEEKELMQELDNLYIIYPNQAIYEERIATHKHLKIRK